MASISNKFTIFLYENRRTTLAMLAHDLDLKTSSLRNTVYGKRPIKKVVVKLSEDSELFDLLPQISKDLIEIVKTEEKQVS